jgi:hypothetical protein
MRLQELFESTEEDRALISLSSAIYDKIKPYGESSTDELVRIGSIGNMFDTSIPGLDKVSICVEGGKQFMQNATADDDATMDWNGKVIYAFWDEETQSVIINKDLINQHRMKTTITHELRHALDELKSGSFPGDAKGYFTPRKKEHRKNDPYSTMQYRAQPAEINARFVEILDILSKRIPQWYNKLDADAIKAQLSRDFNHLLVKYEISDIFPERTQSPDYKRLVKRAYDFMQKEMDHVESELAKNGTPKKATGSF